MNSNQELEKGAVRPIDSDDEAEELAIFVKDGVTHFGDKRRPRVAAEQVPVVYGNNFEELDESFVPEQKAWVKDLVHDNMSKVDYYYAFATCETEDEVSTVYESLMETDSKMVFLINRARMTRLHQIWAGRYVSNHGGRAVYESKSRYTPPVTGKLSTFERAMMQPVGKARKHNPPRIVARPFREDTRNRAAMTANAFWRVPIVQSLVRFEVPPRPTVRNWTRTYGRRWLMVWAAHVWVPRASKHYAVIGNSAAEALYNASNQIHPRILGELLVGAHIWWADMNPPDQRLPAPLVVGDHVPVEFYARLRIPVFTIQGVEIFTVADLTKVEPLFRRDRPVFKAVRDFLMTPMSVKRMQAERRRLVTWLNAKIEKTQGGELGNLLSDFVRDAVQTGLSADLVQFVAFVAALADATSTRQMVSILILYVAQFPSIKDLCSAILEDLFERDDVPVERTQGLGSLATPTWSLDRALLGMILGVGAAFIGERVFAAPAEVSAHFMRNGVFSLEKLGAQSLAETLFEKMTWVVKTLSLCVKQGSLLPLVSPDFDPAVWLFECNALLTYMFEVTTNSEGLSGSVKRLEDLRRKKLIPEHWTELYSFDQVHEMVDEFFKRGTQMRRIVSPRSQLAVDMSRMLDRLRSFQEAFSNSYSVMGPRVRPLGVYMYGPTGAGKTYLCQEVFRMIGRARSYPVDPRYNYAWQMNNNFQDGLGPTQWGIFFNDVDQNVAPPARGSDSHVDAVLKVIDNAPLPVEQSDVALKGKIAARPLLVTYATNFPDGRLNKYSAYHPAFWSRFPLRFEVKAKEQFSKGNGALDPEKVRTCTDGELYDITYYELDLTLVQQGNAPPYKGGVEISRVEMFKLIRRVFECELERQKAVVARMVVSGAFCEKCYADLRVGQECPCERQQGGPEWIACASTVVVAAVSILALRRLTRGLEKTSSLVQKWVLQESATVFRRIDEFEATVKTSMKYVKWGITAVSAGAVVAFFSMMLTQVRQYLQGREANVTGEVPPDWKRADQVFSPGLPFNRPTHSFEDIVLTLSNAVVQVEGVCKVQGVCIAHNMILTVKHVLPAEGEELVIRQALLVHRVLVGPLTVRQVAAKDLVVVKVASLVGVSSPFRFIWPDVDRSLSQFDSVHICGKTLQYAPTANRVVPGLHGNRVLMTNAQTQDGDCGLLYIGLSNTSAWIVGMHISLNVSIMRGAESTAELLSQVEIRAAVTALGGFPAGVVIPQGQVSKRPASQAFTHYPKKSEVWSAVSQLDVQVYPIGTANPYVHGMTTKTSLHRLLYSDDYADLEEEWCGQTPYWTPPNFTGGMREDGVWWSPFTQSLSFLQRHARRSDYSFLALLDYLRPFEDADCSGYRSLSEQEILKGVAGSAIHGVDLSTSMGMPYNEKKRNYVKILDSGVWVADSAWKTFDEFKAVYSSGDIPVPVILATLKDEAVKLGKLARVFCCLPAVANWFFKEVCAPVQLFIRANKGLSECFVGVNMTSLECNEVVEQLRRVDFLLKRIFEYDVTKQDKSIDGVALEYVALAYHYIACLIGVSSFQAYSSVHAGRNGVIVVKNDFFQVGGWNPSGHNDTVQIASLVSTHDQRYVYYRQKFPDGIPGELMQLLQQALANFLKASFRVSHLGLDGLLDFRDHVGLATYGDDALASTTQAYDMPTAFASFAGELGRTFTDGQKDTVVLEPRGIEDVSFLKRGFVWNEELQLFVAPLSRKSLVKMLRWGKKSSLSHIDHSAVVLSDFLRECVYHGERFYEEQRARAIAMAVQHGFAHNAYFKAPVFHVYWDQVRHGTFQTWTPVGLDVMDFEEE